MRTIINYLRSLFCKHDWAIEEKFVKESHDYSGYSRQGMKVSMYCKKCGYNKSFWKF